MGGGDYTIASTGTAIDEFMVVYHHAAMATRHRPGLSTSEVDAMDLAVLASMLGVERSAFESESAAILGARMAAAREGRPVTWDDA